jgi:isopentenyl phosphate kinase
MTGAAGVVLVKLGGSLITDKTRQETPRHETLARLAAELVRALPVCRERLVLAHGSGSFGHVAAQRFGLGGSGGPPPVTGIAVTQDRAAALHRLVVGALIAAGAAPFSLAPSSSVVAAGGVPQKIYAEPLLRALDSGLLPVSYGDVVLDREWGASICSTESLFSLLARALPRHGIAVRRIVWLGETGGVHDGSGVTLPRLDAASFAAAGAAIGNAAGTDVTGGMRHRVEAALDLAARGIPSLIADGTIPGLLEHALRGDPVPGTEIR